MGEHVGTRAFLSWGGRSPKVQLNLGEQGKPTRHLYSEEWGVHRPRPLHAIRHKGKCFVKVLMLMYGRLYS